MADAVLVRHVRQRALTGELEADRHRRDAVVPCGVGVVCPLPTEGDDVEHDLHRAWCTPDERRLDALRLAAAAVPQDVGRHQSSHDVDDVRSPRRAEVIGSAADIRRQAHDGDGNEAASDPERRLEAEQLTAPAAHGPLSVGWPPVASSFSQTMFSIMT